jgi:hypothetical protein
MSKRFYWLKIENLDFFLFSFGLIKFGLLSVFFNKIPQNSIWQIFCNKIQDGNEFFLFFTKYFHLVKKNVFVTILH